MKKILLTLTLLIGVAFGQCGTIDSLNGYPYYTLGGGSDTLILLPGGGFIDNQTNPAFMCHAAQVFADSGFTVILPDYPTVEALGECSDSSFQWIWEKADSHVVNLIDTLGIQSPYFAGLSAGGMIITDIAGSYSTKAVGLYSAGARAPVTWSFASSVYWGELDYVVPEVRFIGCDSVYGQEHLLGTGCNKYSEISGANHFPIFNPSYTLDQQIWAKRVIKDWRECAGNRGYNFGKEKPLFGLNVKTLKIERIRTGQMYIFDGKRVLVTE